MKDKKFKIAAGVASAAVAMVLSACGGGDDGGSAAAPGPQRLTGTVAVGEPRPEIDLLFSCFSNTQQTVTTNAQGEYSVDLSGVSLPCRIETTTGKPLTGFTASATGVANVTTLTTLAMGLAGAEPNLDEVNEAWGHVRDILKSLQGIDLSALDANPFTTAFKANGQDPLDKVMDDLTASGLPLDVLLKQFEELHVGNFLTGKEEVKKALQKVVDQAAVCVNAGPNDAGCWRMQKPESAELGQLAYFSKAQPPQIILEEGVEREYVPEGPHGPTVRGFNRTFTTEGGFTLQLCNQSAPESPSVLEYQLISSKARMVDAARWAEIMNLRKNDPEANEEEKRGDITFTLQENCVMKSGEDPANTFGNTSVEVSKLLVRADGSGEWQGAELRDGEGWVSYTDPFTADQLKNALFGRDSFPSGGDPWLTRAVVYEYPAYDGPVLAIALDQTLNAGADRAEAMQDGMFGAAVLLEWDGFKPSQLPGLD